MILRNLLLKSNHTLKKKLEKLVKNLTKFWMRPIFKMIFTWIFWIGHKRIKSQLLLILHFISGLGVLLKSQDCMKLVSSMIIYALFHFVMITKLPLEIVMAISKYLILLRGKKLMIFRDIMEESEVWIGLTDYLRSGLINKYKAHTQ